MRVGVGRVRHQDTPKARSVGASQGGGDDDDGFLGVVAEMGSGCGDDGYGCWLLKLGVQSC